ncbi:MAG: DMT family transporter [Sphingorhabdus sp.]
MADPIIIPPIPATNPERPLLGIMLRLAAMAMLGVMFALVKMAGNRGVHVSESLFWRQLAGLPVVMLWLWWTNNLGSIRTKRPMAHALRTGLGLTSMCLNFLAMMLLPMAAATTIGFAMPIFATMLAALLLGEATGRYRWAAIFLGFIGVLVAVQPGQGAIHGPGALVAISGALLTACVAIQLRRMSKEESTGAIVFWFSLCSLPPLGIAMLFFGRSHDGATWLVIAGLAAAGAIAQILLTAAMRHASVAAILTMDYSGLIWSILFGYLLFDDIPGIGIFLGAPIIIAAGLIIAWREQHLARQRP